MVYFAKWKVILVLVICALGIAFSAPNFVSRHVADSLPHWLPYKQVSLGLDLQGGSHLLLEVQVKKVIEDRLNSMVDTMRGDLNKAKVRYTNLGVVGQSATVTITSPDQVDTAASLMRKIDPGASLVRGDNGKLSLQLSDKALTELRSSAVQQSIEIIRRRIDETGVREPTIQRQGEDRILVQLPGIQNPERVKKLIGETAKMTFHLVDDRPATAGRVPPGDELLPYDAQHNPELAGQKLLVEKRVMVDGQNLTDAQPGFDQRTSEPIVNFRFDTLGARKFGAATTENVNRRMAIVLDGKVISAPVIREPILQGSGQISGSFTVQQASDLALLLRAGALPAPITYLEERTVGPSLGADSIADGKIASIVGLVLVILFMVLAYGRFGVMADIALLFNIVLILAALSVFQATLTLPGIAGIVLTIGMAVDANVLVFERIREELRLGRTPISAIDAGYSRALSTIVDSNLTTLIAAVLLYMFGSGPVRGFAVTLAIGIVTSMFTAIMVTRLMVVTWLRRKRPQQLTV